MTCSVKINCKYTMSKCKKDEAAQLKGRPVQQNRTNPNLIMQLTCQSAFFIDDAEEMVMLRIVGSPL